MTEPAVLVGGPHHGTLLDVGDGVARVERAYADGTPRFYDRTGSIVRDPRGVDRVVFAWVPQ